MDIYEKKYLTSHLTSAVTLVWTKHHYVISEAWGSPGAHRWSSYWARGRVLPSPGGSLKYWVGNCLNIKYSRTLPAGRSSAISVSNLCIFPLKIEAQFGGQHSRLLLACVCPLIPRTYNMLVVVRWEQDPRALHLGVPAKPPWVWAPHWDCSHKGGSETRLRSWWQEGLWDAPQCGTLPSHQNTEFNQHNAGTKPKEENTGASIKKKIIFRLHVTRPLYGQIIP